MKKIAKAILVAAMAIIMILPLSACQKKQQIETESDNQQEIIEPIAEPIRDMGNNSKIIPEQKAKDGSVTKQMAPDGNVYATYSDGNGIYAYVEQYGRFVPVDKFGPYIYSTETGTYESRAVLYPEQVTQGGQLRRTVIGQTGQKLLELGFEIIDYDVDNMKCTMRMDSFDYSVSFDTQQTITEKAEEGFDAIKFFSPLTVMSIDCIGEN